MRKSIKSVIVFSMVLLAIDLIYHQVVNGSLPLLPEVFHETGFILQYCREHASDSVNPVQDLVDKGIITWGWFDGETCMSVKQMHDAFLINEREKITPYCHDTLKEHLGTEPPKSEIDICVANVLELRK